MTALRILIVEDEALIAMLLADVLESMGHEVCATAATEKDAVLAATLHKPDLMIVDVRLREGSGLSAISDISRTGFISNVLVSGETIVGQMLDPRSVFLQKPFREPDLARAMAQALSFGVVG